jgi:multidrug transporter EmrE-like cation transporter
VANRISTLISAFGVFVSVILLIGALREYRTGASGVWVGLGTSIFLCAVWTLVRDVRRSRRTGSA